MPIELIQALAILAYVLIAFGVFVSALSDGSAMMHPVLVIFLCSFWAIFWPVAVCLKFGCWIVLG